MKKHLLSIAIVCFLTLTVAACGTQSPAVVVADGQSTKQVNVTGTGQVAVTPDVAYINIGVRSQAESVADALKANNAQAQQIKDVLMEQGVEEKDIQTSSFNVYPQTEYDFNGNPVKNTFVVENTVYVTVRDLDAMGSLLDVVAQNGANSIYGIYFDLLDKTEALKQARELAVEYAKVQAEEIASAAGVELGEILNISVYSMIAEGYGIGGGYASQAFSKVPVSAGPMVITADVNIAYAIK